MLSFRIDSSYAQTLSYNGSVSFSTGSYIFAERTNSLFFLNGMTLTTSRAVLSLGLPIIFQNTPWISSSGVGMIPSGGIENSQVGKKSPKGIVILPDTTSYEKIGIGDPIFHVAFRLIGERKALPEISLTADLKFPLAEIDRGFGTGEWDYAFGVSCNKTIAEMIFFLDVSYWFIGDMPDLVLHDTVAYSIAFGFPLGAGKWSLMTSFYGNSNIVEQVDPPLLVNLGLNHYFQSQSSVNASLGFGLTESAPDVAVSVGWWVGN